jgi:beta-lactam-binding protein with PASTA domain/predicted Ser/Thr protein kinase
VPKGGATHRMARGSVRNPGSENPLAVIASTIEGRYQIIARVAAGGMGEVYRAHDSVLGREVAVKVLHPHFAGDRGFVDRFRREARAAAILNHPNIVGVYDWGETDGTYFMVMEFVQGSNLRALLSEYERLEPAQVIDVCLPVLSALDHAHGHGIVHRDIKPENILIARNGVVKVADFGLARAYADSYVSQAEGTVTGTVQYLAPEQIQGEPADPRTDLYALGVVMFELLTGSPPFTGETSLAIAYQHLSGSVPAPSSIVPGTPRALDLAVTGATDRDRTRRPPSARALGQELQMAARDVSPSRPVAELAGQIPAPNAVAEDRATTVTIPRAASPRAKRARRLRLAAWSVVVALVLAAGAGAGWVYAIPHYTRVPSVGLLSIEQAEARLRAAGLSPFTGPGQFSSTVEVNHILATKPPPGSRIRKGTRVVLIPSKGPELLPVPDVGGLKLEKAKDAITKAGFEPNVEREFNDDVAEGKVIRQSPDANVNLERGQEVTITVSKGPAPVEVPEVRGKTTEQARATLEATGFRVTVAEEFSEDIAKDHAIRTDPSAGKRIDKGSQVTLVVSKGPQTFPMPKVVGMKVDDAKKKLQDLGLVVQLHDLGFPFDGTVVQLQDPDPGTTMQQGDKVQIWA